MDCSSGTDCSDCTDADGDGINLTLDCDDNNVDLGAITDDEDCNGLCDNGSGTLLLEDMDCDGILNSDDTDADGDLICDETGTVTYIDTDCDGVDDVTDFVRILVKLTVLLGQMMVSATIPIAHFMTIPMLMMGNVWLEQIVLIVPMPMVMASI